MKIRDLNNVCVVDFDKKSMSDAEIYDLRELLTKKSKDKRIGLNMDSVTVSSHEFGKLLQEFDGNSRLSLFNMNNESLLFIYIAKYDMSADIYLSEEDFCTDKRSFVNRRFKVLKTA